MTNTPEGSAMSKPIAYFKATEKHGILWGEDCCCADPVYGDYEDYEDQQVINLAVYPASVVEALKAENKELKEVNDSLHRSSQFTYECQKKSIADLKAENESQAKRIAELEDELKISKQLLKNYADILADDED